MNSVHPTELSQIVILDTMQITMYRRSQAMAHTIVCIMVVSRTSDLSRHHSIISWSENSVSSSWTWWWCLGRYLHYIRRLIYLYLPLRTSVMNCSWIYNEGSNNNEINPFLLATWFYSLKMWVDDVWNGFFIHCLLLDHEEQNVTIQLTHTAQSQSKWLQPALKACNAQMHGPGQEHWNHACDLCCWVYTNSNDVKRKIPIISHFESVLIYLTRVSMVCYYQWDQHGLPLL